MALLWPKHGPHMILQIGSSRILINVPEGYSMPNFTLLGVSCSCCFNKWPIYGPFLLENGPHMVLRIGSSWILIKVPRDVPCLITHCLVYPIAPFPRNNMLPYYGPNMVLTYSFKSLLPESWSVWPGISHCWVYPTARFPRNGQNMTLLWQKHSPNMVLQVGFSWILINVPMAAPCNISHNWMYPVTPFPRNGQNMAILWLEHGSHIGLQIGSSWILITVPRNVPCQSSHCWVYPVVPIPRNGLYMALYGQNYFSLNLNQCAQGCSMPNFILLGLSCSPLS